MIENKGISFTTIIPGTVELKRGNRAYQNYKNHMHQELSIGIISEGSTTVMFPEETVKFVKGDGIIIPPKLSHMCSPDNIDRWCFDMLYINPSFYSDVMTFDKVLKVIDTSPIETFLDCLDSPYDTSYIEEQLVELLEGLYERHEAAQIMEKQSSLIDEGVKAYIEEHALEKITLEELEERFNIKRFALIRKFRKTYNTTPLAYQLQLKMAKAKKLLMEQTPILDVCYALGFYDQAHFTREFKKMNGLTPSAYRESILH